jgi:hypothetical protein
MKVIVLPVLRLGGQALIYLECGTCDTNLSPVLNLAKIFQKINKNIYSKPIRFLETRQ